MLARGTRRKLEAKTLSEKFKILKEIEGGESSARVAKCYNIAKQTVSNWMKKKDRIFSLYQDSVVRQSRQRIRSSPYDKLDKACSYGL